MPRRTALIVVVPEAEDAVGALRLRHDSPRPHAREVTFIVEDELGRWAERSRFALGPAP
jgi:hypothetical protein